MSVPQETQLPLLRVAACSYEGSLFGWDVQENAEHMELASTLKFGFNVTIGCLRALACSLSGKYLVVGGMDERIRIYNMKDNRSVGELMQHTGAITALKFFNDAYLISSAEDFNLCIWRVYDWQCVHILGGHKDTITDFSIHPTGKMALSVSKDHTLKLWNLVQGRCAFTRRLKAPTDQVIWHHTGDFYLLATAHEVQLFKASDNACVATLTHGSRVNRACFTTVTTGTGAGKDAVKGWRMVTICDNKSINLFDFAGKQTACVDLSCLGSGRPRDVHSSTINATAVTHKEMHSMLAAEAECLTVITSQGQVLVLSAHRLEQLGVQQVGTTTSSTAAAAGAAEGTGETAESALLSSHQLRAEPRLTAVVSWNPAEAAAHAAAKGNKRAQHMLESEGPSHTDDAAQQGEHHDGEQAAAQKKEKSKKAKRVTVDEETHSAGAVTPIGSAGQKQGAASKTGKASDINDSGKNGATEVGKNKDGKKKAKLGNK